MAAASAEGPGSRKPGDGVTDGKGSTASSHYYDSNAALTRPVTTIQVSGFTPREGWLPSLVLADGSYYFGPVAEDGGYRIPSGCGIMLFRYDETTTPNFALSASGGGGLSSLFFGRGVPRGRGTSAAAGALTALCQRYQRGDRYGGDWANGVFHGEGVLLTGTFTYHGTWSDGRMQGKGTISYSRKYVDHAPPRFPGANEASSQGSGGMSTLLLKGLAYVSPFDLTASAALPKEYTGDFDAQHDRHGKGVMQYYNMDVYEGEWRANVRHGRGTLRKVDGEVYDGDWAFDQRHGNGKIFYPNGSVFKGHMAYDQRHGEGIMRFANGDEFFGLFCKDRIEGLGVMRYRNGDVYNGAWQDQLRHGRGRYTLRRTGATMCGEFQSGLIHGEGSVVVPGVSTFVGQFVRGEKTFGTIHWHEDETGAQRADLPPASLAASVTEAGPSVETPSPSPSDTTPSPADVASASPQLIPSTATTGVGPSVSRPTSKGYLCFQGGWHGEHMHGKGLLWYRNGDFYAGRFHKSQRHGAGNMRYAAENSEFSGQFVHGVRQGWGLLQRADGTIRAGRWYHNIFIEGYEGEWDGVAFHGIGRLTMPVEAFLAMRASRSGLKPAELQAILNETSHSLPYRYLSAISDEEGRGIDADEVTTAAATSTSDAVETAASPATARLLANISSLYIDFFGLFRDGVRDGLGLLKMPALDGLLGSSVNLVDARKPCSTGSGHGGSADDRCRGSLTDLQGTRGRGSTAAAGHLGGGPSSLSTAPFMVVKGRWIREVLHCDKAVVAFPSGFVYVGGVRNGARDATRARVWGPDGSVLECSWCADAPSGPGVWYQRNRIDPVYRTIVPSVLRRSRTRHDAGGDAAASHKIVPSNAEVEGALTHRVDPHEDSGGNSGLLSRNVLGLSYLWNLIGLGSHGVDGNHDRADEGAKGSGDDDDDRPRRVLIDFHPHYVFSCAWYPSSMDLGTYATVVLPQLSHQTAPLSSGAPWPLLYRSSSMSAAVALAGETTAATRTSGGSSSNTTHAATSTTAADSTAELLRWPTPSAKQISACANDLHLPNAPATVQVGRAHGLGVAYFSSGVVLAGDWLGNAPRLAVPYRPWSAFDHFLVWQAGRAVSRNCAGTAPLICAPRLQSCFTSILAAAPDDVHGELRRMSRTRLATAASPLSASVAGATADQRSNVTSSTLRQESPDLCCMLCKKEYSFFRKRSHCTLCLRSSCSSCLGLMDTDGATLQEDVKALLRHAYVASEQTLHLAKAAASKGTSSSGVGGGGASASANRPICFPTITMEMFEHAFDTTIVPNVPVCADCMRAILWRLRYTQLWIPTSILSSVLEGERERHHTRHRAEHRDGDASLGDKRGTAVSGGEKGCEPTEAAVRNAPRNDLCSQESRRHVSAAGESLPAPQGNTAESGAVVYDGGSSTGVMEAADAPGAPSLDGDATKSLATPATGPPPLDDATPHTVPSTPPDDPLPPGGEDLYAAAAQGMSLDDSPAPAAPYATGLGAGTAPSTADPHASSPLRSEEAILPPSQYIVYSGYTSHAIPHLYGELWWGRKHYYRGGFCAGERHGFGTQYMPNGEWYEGGFARNAWHGEGAYHLDDGSVLLGEFRRGKLHILHYRGEVEESEAAGMQPHGRGVSYSPDGSIYNGEWLHGKRHGTGMLEFADGSSVYSGTFVADAMEGMGKLITTSGAYYGDFSQNQQNGKGLLFTTSCVVEGSWTQGLSCGFTRIYERASNEVYETTYHDDNERDDCFAAPMIVEDDEATDCGQCGTAFSFFLRRHHCRLCGDVFCDACTQHRATLPQSIIGNGGSGGDTKGNVSNESIAATALQQRVCDACFCRLTQRRMLALRRYTDGSVYAGSWSQGRWVSRGLYCRPDGIFVVMDRHGQALLASVAIEREKGQLGSELASPPSEADPTPSMRRKAAPAVGGLGVRGRSSRTKGLPISPSILQDAAPSKDELDRVKESSPRKELDAFLLWWSTTRIRCGGHVSLDIALVARYQQLPSHHLRGKEATVKVGSDAALLLASPARCTRVAPSTPSLSPICLFIPLSDARRAMQAMVEGEVVSNVSSDATESVHVRMSMEELRTIDADVEAAALRASRFMAMAIPRAPVVPVTAAVAPVTSALREPAASWDTESTTTPSRGADSSNLHLKDNVEASLQPQPGPFSQDGGHFSLRHEQERHKGTTSSPSWPDGGVGGVFGVSAWVARPPPSIEDEDISDEILVDMMRAERLTWSTPSGVEAGSACMPTLPPLMPPTPKPPRPDSNESVSWELWNTHKVPRYAPPAAKAVSEEGTAADLQREAAAAGDDKKEPPPPPRTEADLYFACPCWSPEVPDAQLLVEQGKMVEAAKLMQRLQLQRSRLYDAKHPQSCPTQTEIQSEDGEDDNEEKSKKGSGAVRGYHDNSTGHGAALLQQKFTTDAKASAFAWDAGHLFSPEQRACSGSGWAPAPMFGPFTFEISPQEKWRSPDGKEWHPKVVQTEMKNF